MPLPIVRLDRANHFIYGALVFLVTLLVMRAFGAHPIVFGIHFRRKDIALFVTIFVAAAKEISDWLMNRGLIARGQPPQHGVQGVDFSWTSLAGLNGWLIAED